MVLEYFNQNYTFRPSSTLVLGTTAVLRLTYNITNNGEFAYHPKFSVTNSAGLSLAQVPGNCKVNEAVMVCDLNHGQRMAKGDTDSLTISFDVRQLRGRSLEIQAEVLSARDESNPENNKLTNVLSLRKKLISMSAGMITFTIKTVFNIAKILNNFTVFRQTIMLSLKSLLTQQRLSTITRSRATVPVL